MATNYEVQCINKSDRTNNYERITHIGGVQDGTRWRMTQEDAIAGIESGNKSFHVEKNGHKVKVIVALSRFGNKYIKTENDGDSPDNLLSLQECPK